MQRVHMKYWYCGTHILTQTFSPEADQFFQFVMRFYVQKDQISLQSPAFPGKELRIFHIFSHHGQVTIKYTGTIVHYL